MSHVGTLYILSAPSGAGKSSLIQAFLKTQPLYDAQVSVSHTTRAKREGEQDGIHYHFIQKEQFEQMIQSGDFLEHAEVFGQFYGTSKQTILETLHSGVDVFLDIDWQGARQIRQQMPESVSIFILPPSKSELLRRLKGRGQDSDEVISYRMQKAISEMEHHIEYDYLIINDDFEKALNDLKTILRAEKLKHAKQVIMHQSLIEQLLDVE